MLLPLSIVILTTSLHCHLLDRLARRREDLIQPPLSHGCPDRPRRYEAPTSADVNPTDCTTRIGQLRIDTGGTQYAAVGIGKDSRTTLGDEVNNDACTRHSTARCAEIRVQTIHTTSLPSHCNQSLIQILLHANRALALAFIGICANCEISILRRDCMK